MFWNPDLNFYEQQDDTQMAVYDAMGNPPADEVTEPCGDGFTRPLSQIFVVSDTITIKVTYLYVNAPDSDEWAALKNVIIENNNPN